MYCRYCGSPMHQSENKESDFSSVLLFVWVVATCVLKLINEIIFKLVDDWSWYESTKAAVFGNLILQNLMMLLPAFAIKNKALKIMGIIVMLMLVVWCNIKHVQAM